MDTSTLVQNQLLATKFYMPVAPGTLIARPRLTALLDKSVNHSFTLVSAAAGFGKTTLLSTWARSLGGSPVIAWISLDEEDNDPRLFWTYILTALNMHRPKHFIPLVEALQSPRVPSLKYLLTSLINLLVESTDHFVLILDDYQMITEPQVHTSLAYLVEHLPPQLHIILATRADPPLPLPLLRAREQALEVRTEQLRCTLEETRAFFQQVIGIQLPEETIREVAAHTEGWLVGLQLLGLSLSEHVDPSTLLEEVSGDQRYILDYLVEEVLRRQSQDVQTFLLSTSILEQLSASLCDAVMERAGSQQMLQRLEQTNLFVVSLDSRREWYRYHALFAEALRSQLEEMYADLVFTLHRRASLWYVEHDQTAEAVLHAFCAHDWQLAGDLIERKSLQLMTLTWGAGQHALLKLQRWLEQLPAEVLQARPRLCLACTELLWAVTLPAKLDAWLDAAEACLTVSLSANASLPIKALEARQEQENQLGEVITFRAVVRSHEEESQAALPLCQRALALLSVDNFAARAIIAWIQLRVLYVSAINNAGAAIEIGLQAGPLALTAGKTALAIGITGATVIYMIGARRLHEVYQLTQQAIQLGIQPGELVSPDICWPTIWQAEVLREWNDLDAALKLIEEALSLYPQTASIVSITYVLFGHVVLLRIALSRGELERACSALQEFERVRVSMNQPLSLYYHSFFSTVDQVRLWLACGKLDLAIDWVEKLDLTGQHGTPFAIERESVARARIFLATAQPTQALQRLEPALERSIMGKRWGHVIEIQILRALAYQMCQQQMQALDALSEAVHLGESEGYIRSFVDEGAPMETLLYRLRKRDRDHGPTPYLDTVLAAFQKEDIAHVSIGETVKVQLLPEPLSERELQVLQLMAHGASNQEIAQKLVIAVDTVKRHISHIFSKLGVKNRVQAAEQARTLDLLNE